MPKSSSSRSPRMGAARQASRAFELRLQRITLFGVLTAFSAMWRHSGTPWRDTALTVAAIGFAAAFLVCLYLLIQGLIQNR